MHVDEENVGDIDGLATLVLEDQLDVALVVRADVVVGLGVGVAPQAPKRLGVGVLGCPVARAILDDTPACREWSSNLIWLLKRKIDKVLFKSTSLSSFFHFYTFSRSS